MASTRIHCCNATVDSGGWMAKVKQAKECVITSKRSLLEERLDEIIGREHISL